MLEESVADRYRQSLAALLLVTQSTEMKMPHSQLKFLLGAGDPEMQVIESLLDSCSQEWEYATADGRRVHPGNAYRADPVSSEARLVFVECRFLSDIPDDHIVVDHHNPGDPGYGSGPDEFWTGSSLGQVVELLREFGH